MKTRSLASREVRIVVPKLFLRCGYPLTKNMVADELGNDLSARVQLLAELGKLNANDFHVRKSLSDAIICDELRKRNFGGCERQIFEKEVESIANRVVRVESTKRVMTGTYSPGWGGYSSYLGEYDYEPAYLADAKVHVVCTLDPSADLWNGIQFDWNWWPPRILATHVEAIQ